MILVGDIGGTKTILASYVCQEGDWVCVNKQVFASANFNHFDCLLDDFLSEDGKDLLQGVCLGVAGPVKNGRCQTTNLPWLLDQENIANKLTVKHVMLLNDLEATAWGLLSLADDQLIELNSSLNTGTTAGGHKAVIAAGTGLGEAIIFHDGDNYHVIAGEGGHADFAPNNDQEQALLKFMRNKYPDHVSCERLISGEGLYNIYQFLKYSREGQESEAFNRQLQQNDPAAVIGKAGVAQENELSSKAVKLFGKLYGSEAANLALKCLPYGGIYLAGGIAGKLLPVLGQGGFMESFLAKGRYRSILKNISVKVCLNEECALEGALEYAHKNFKL